MNVRQLNEIPDMISNIRNDAEFAKVVTLTSGRDAIMIGGLVIELAESDMETNNRLVLHLVKVIRGPRENVGLQAAA